MTPEITTDDLKRIAEACGYEDYHEGRKAVLIDDEWIDFRPHLDANQAIECLDRRFNTGYSIDRDENGNFLVFAWVVDTRGTGRSLPAAAMAAILVSLEGDDAESV